jgi:GNAT superfamily N-acetyltransferase
MSVGQKPIIEPATAEDLDDLSNLLGELFSQEEDFRPDKEKQLRGLRLIFEQPNRGRVFVLRRDGVIVAMINLLFTISTAEGGFVLLLEDLVVHDSHRDQGYGSMLLDYAIDFAKQKKFLRITLLTDRPEIRSQNFFNATAPANPTFADAIARPQQHSAPTRFSGYLFLSLLGQLI